VEISNGHQADSAGDGREGEGADGGYELSWACYGN